MNSKPIFIVSLVSLCLAVTSLAQSYRPYNVGGDLTDFEVWLTDKPRTVPHAKWESLFSATTPNGKQLSAQEMKPLVLSAVLPSGSWGSRNEHLRIGVFLVSVLSDGTVSNVEVLNSTGFEQGDLSVQHALLRWRFRANSVKAARVPYFFVRTH
jgi:TonB family protein